ncbi:MAG: hypothetical protein II119_02120 [Bacilli bacterium]|nr:hypothetical protein [Bacilli bacterium]
MIFTMQLIYLSIIMLIIGEALKKIDFINKKLIILYLFVISLLLNFIFHGISVQTLFESIISVSLSVLYYDVIRLIRN